MLYPHKSEKPTPFKGGSMSHTKRIIAQARLNNELKGLKVERKRNSSECPYCRQMERLIAIDKNSSKVWDTCQDVLGNRMEGISEQEPKCPKCDSFIGAKQTEFKGFYNDNGKISKKDIHIHLCPKCDWKSKEYNGTFVSRD